ncbi:MAG: site-specific DNA-methyltransferase, partial [Deltaproteobacteria bacterium]|nr:site-specific DNA-methyltransferase [Deltaproteobacteria bacterium]
MQGNKGISRPGSPRRRSFSQKALEVESSGPLGEVLAGALTKSGESGYRLTHSFHPYPGRFHPGLPELILQRVARPGQWILDPFMGGGSTLVEALLQGLGAMGNDLNPVARLVARERTRCREPAEAAALQGEAARIAGLVEALRNDRHPPRFTRRELGPLRKHYQPHLLAELTQWIRLIEDVKAFKVRETLRAVFSSAVVKFSNRASDSSQEEQQTSYPKGAVTRFLTAKTGELAQAQRELARRLPA